MTVSSRRRTGMRSRYVRAGRRFERRRCLGQPALTLGRRCGRARPRALDGGRETIALDRFQQVIDRVQLERLDGKVVMRGDERDRRRRAGLEEPRHIEAAGFGHVQIEEGEIGPPRLDQVDRLLAVAGLADDLDVRKRLEQVDQEPARRPLIVSEDDSKRSRPVVHPDRPAHRSLGERGRAAATISAIVWPLPSVASDSSASPP